MAFQIRTTNTFNFGHQSLLHENMIEQLHLHLIAPYGLCKFLNSGCVWRAPAVWSLDAAVYLLQESPVDCLARREPSVVERRDFRIRWHFFLHVNVSTERRGDEFRRTVVMIV